MFTVKPPLPFSLPSTTTTSTPVCRITWTIYFFLEKRYSRTEGRKLVHHHHHSSCPTHVVVSSFFLASSCLCTLLRRRSESLGLCCCFVCLSQSLRAHLDALRARGRSAAVQYMEVVGCKTEAGSCTLRPGPGAMLFHGISGDHIQGIMEEMERRSKTESRLAKGMQLNGRESVRVRSHCASIQVKTR